MSALDGGPALDEIDAELLATLREASGKWGPLGVARAAAKLVGDPTNETGHEYDGVLPSHHGKELFADRRDGTRVDSTTYRTTWLDPRNYSARIVVDGRTMFVCVRCGALVHTRKAHNEFHDSVERGLRVVSNGERHGVFGVRINAKLDDVEAVRVCVPDGPAAF